MAVAETHQSNNHNNQNTRGQQREGPIRFDSTAEARRLGLDCFARFPTMAATARWWSLGGPNRTGREPSELSAGTGLSQPSQHPPRRQLLPLESKPGDGHAVAAFKNSNSSRVAEVMGRAPSPSGSFRNLIATCTN